MEVAGEERRNNKLQIGLKEREFGISRGRKKGV